MGGDSRGHSKRALARGLALGLLVSVITTGFSYLGFLESWENGVFDFLVWWEKEKRSADVFLVEISDADYRDLFHSTSPLSRRVLAELMVDLARGGPRVIGLDVDLSTPTAEDGLLAEALERIHESKVPVVLAGPEPSFRAPDGVFFGTVNYPLDKDGVLRKMRLALESDGRGKTPSFALSIVAAGEGWTWEAFRSALGGGETIPSEGAGGAGKAPALLEGSRHSPSLRIHYIGDKRSFNALSGSSFLKAPDAALESSTLLSGKIVLVGGTFAESRDFHPTPKGLMSGTEVIANSVETLLSAKPLKPVSHLFEFLFEAAMVLVLSLVFARFAPFKASLIALLAVVPLAVAGSFVAFSSLSRWLNFVPAAASVLLHGEFSLFEHYSELKKSVANLEGQLKEKDRKIGELEAELALSAASTNDPEQGGGK